MATHRLNINFAWHDHTRITLPRPEGRGYHKFSPKELLFSKAISLKQQST